MDAIFKLCVWILELVAGVLGISYNALNVWIFCIAWPGFTICLIWMIVRQYKKIKELENVQKIADLRWK